MTEPREVPSGVYYNAEADNFYSASSRRGMGATFYKEWRYQAHRFPTNEDDANGEEPKR